MKGDMYMCKEESTCLWYKPEEKWLGKSGCYKHPLNKPPCYNCWDYRKKEIKEEKENNNK